ncbi:MAG: dimethylsulfonioproprionate lyase family protein [Gammaproteobacteria bacterium]|nr:dimethylsulfonioproprionate lyase family protein [Gammaproteobacteria bacterium]
MSERLEQLIDMAWQAVEARVDITGKRRIRRPPTEALRNPRIESRFGDDFAALAELERALEIAADGELAQLAQGVASALGEFRWSQNASYTEDTVSRELLDGYTYAPLTGPDSPIRCEVPLAGFLLMTAHSHYRDHRHEAREIYLVLTPGSCWSLDSGDWFDVKPGDLIFHDSWQMHAMRTADEPLLAFAAWIESGDRNSIEI